MASTEYKALVLTGKRQLLLETRKMKPLMPEQVRVKMVAVGICGSDMHYFNTFGNVGYGLRHPLILGHEASGIIVEVGENVSRLSPGEKVVVNPLMHCGICPACRRGQLSLCEDAQFPGSALTVPHIDGFFREYFETAERCCLKMPESVDLSIMALADPLACALHAIGQVDGVMGKRVLITGVGTVGVMSAAASRACGATEIVVTGRKPHALAIAKHMGADMVVDTTANADLAGLGCFDVVMETTGVAPLIVEGLRLLRKGGSMVQIGSPSGEGITVPWVLFMEKELRVTGAMRWNNEFEVAVSHILCGRIDPAPVLSGQFKISDGDQAFEAAADHNKNMKVQFIA